MYKLTDAEFSFFSDAHKDAYGFRPRWDDCDVFESKEAWEKEARRLCDTISEVIEQERVQKRMRLKSFFEDMRAIIETHNVDLPTAIRWDIDAEDAKMGGIADIGYYCYHKGIDYRHERRIGRMLGIPFYVNQAVAA